MSAPRAQWSYRLPGLIIIALGCFALLSILTYHPDDVPLLTSHPNHPPENLGGILGVWVGFLGRGGFGWASLLLPLACAAWARQLWRGAPLGSRGLSLTFATVSLMAAAGTLLALRGATEVDSTLTGGLIGLFFSKSGAYYLGTAGTVLTACCVTILSWLVVFGISGRSEGAPAARSSGLFSAWIQGLFQGWFSARPRPTVSTRSAASGREAAGSSARPKDAAPGSLRLSDGERPEALLPPPPPVVRLRPSVAPKPKAVPPPVRRQAPGGFQMPSMDLLTDPPPIAERQLTEDLQTNARVLEETLREFGIEATVVNIDRGPTVTRYELTPAPGVKLTKIVSLSDDLALVMKAANCHVVAPIPGKGTVGVDVPNAKGTVVYLKEILTAPEFSAHPSPLAIPVGKDVSGNAIVTDLRECPHLLIAGATGSGKTVCLNSVLTGILTHASPDQVKLLMIDPKMVEMAMFNGIPHLVAPVVTNAKKASMALQWAVEEMERRYQLLAKVGARNIDLYNKRIVSQGPAPAPKPQPQADGEDEGPADDGKPLPFIIIVIDELADLMMVASQDVESAIARLAQLSRAVGIHIILATQRPSVDVITGVIKANFPARMAFQVASKVDSRTILDMNGADKLLGRGDLLFLPPGAAKPIRAQGAFVTDAEIEALTNFLKQQQSPSYDERLMEKARQPEGAAGVAGEKDEMYETAKQLVLDTGQASTSLLQRRLRLGYGRAARILDLMEQEGIVGPPQGSRPRDILITREAVARGEQHG